MNNISEIKSMLANPEQAVATEDSRIMDIINERDTARLVALDENEEVICEAESIAERVGELFVFRRDEVEEVLKHDNVDAWFAEGGWKAIPYYQSTHYILFRFDPEDENPPSSEEADA